MGRPRCWIECYLIHVFLICPQHRAYCVSLVYWWDAVSVLWATIEDALSGLRAWAKVYVLEIDFEKMTRI